MYLQQGDVLLKQTSTLPKGIKTLKSYLLHKGQNHHHRMRGKFKIALEGERRFLISKGAELFHEEHKTIQVPEGSYEMGIVVEYDHWLEESRAVID